MIDNKVKVLEEPIIVTELVVELDASDNSGINPPCGGMSMVGKPTEDQLSRINKFSMKPLSAEDVFVFRPLMIDDQETSYVSIVHPNLLKTFMQNSCKGVGLLLSHNSGSLPVGRTFNAELIQEYDMETNNLCTSLYGEVYIALDRNTESGMSTTDIAKGIETGTIFDVSVGFSAKEQTCSICGGDIRSYSECPHNPGKDYSIDNEDGTSCVKKCQVIVGEDGKGELLELSLVYAGACDRATIVNNFSKNNVTNDDSGTKLIIVDNIKSVPQDANIYHYFSKHSTLLLTDAKEEQNLMKLMDIRSEDNMKYLELFNNKFGLSLETEEELTVKLDEIQTEMATSKDELSNVQLQLDEKNICLEEKTTEIELLKGEVSIKDTTIEALTNENSELKKSEEIANTYRKDLVDSTIESGIRAFGNAFNAETFTKFLNTLSLEEIKTTRDGFETEVKTRFQGTRITDPVKPASNEQTTKEDFETEAEYRTYIADKAVIYARENEISILEATKILYKDNLSRRSE